MKTQLMSFNIRINVLVDGKHAWDFRKPFVNAFLASKLPDLIGFQEVNASMLSDLKQALPMYESYGLPRDQRGEGTPIFVKSDRFQVVASGTFWLSDTPEYESKMTGSHFPRISTYVVLQSQHQRTLFFNTHLDYASDDIALAQAKVLYQKMIELQSIYQGSLLLTGDFNVYPESKTIRYLSSKLNCVYDDKKRIGLTFHGFTRETEGKPIDYIFSTKDIAMTSFEIIHYPLSDQYLSDHYPIAINYEMTEGFKT
jgi:endonuclease/exonuclease/phosphatase family metal-dependent hydrolase